MDGLDRLTGEGLSSFQRYTNASLNPMMESDSSLCSLNMLNGASASFQRVVRNSFQVTDRETLNSLASFFNGAESLPSKAESEKRQASLRQKAKDRYHKESPFSMNESGRSASHRAPSLPSSRSGAATTSSPCPFRPPFPVVHIQQLQYATPDIQGIQLILTSIRLEGTSPAEEKKAAYVTRELLASAREVLA